MRLRKGDSSEDVLQPVRVGSITAQVDARLAAIAHTWSRELETLIAKLDVPPDDAGANATWPAEVQGALESANLSELLVQILQLVGGTLDFLGEDDDKPTHSGATSLIRHLVDLRISAVRDALWRTWSDRETLAAWLFDSETGAWTIAAITEVRLLASTPRPDRMDDVEVALRLTRDIATATTPSHLRGTLVYAPRDLAPLAAAVGRNAISVEGLRLPPASLAERLNGLPGHDRVLATLRVWPRVTWTDVLASSGSSDRPWGYREWLDASDEARTVPSEGLAGAFEGLGALMALCYAVGARDMDAEDVVFSWGRPSLVRLPGAFVQPGLGLEATGWFRPNGPLLADPPASCRVLQASKGQHGKSGGASSSAAVDPTKHVDAIQQGAQAVWAGLGQLSSPSKPTPFPDLWVSWSPHTPSATRDRQRTVLQRMWTLDDWADLQRVERLGDLWDIEDQRSWTLWWYQQVLHAEATVEGAEKHLTRTQRAWLAPKQTAAAKALNARSLTRLTPEDLPVPPDRGTRPAWQTLSHVVELGWTMTTGTDWTADPDDCWQVLPTWALDERELVQFATGCEGPLLVRTIAPGVRAPDGSTITLTSGAQDVVPALSRTSFLPGPPRAAFTEQAAGWEHEARVALLTTLLPDLVHQSAKHTRSQHGSR